MILIILTGIANWAVRRRRKRISPLGQLGLWVLFRGARRININYAYEKVCENISYTPVIEESGQGASA
jgi:hypothetical protein